MSSPINLIGLSGYARSGKDTFANHLSSSGFLGRPVRQIAFADPMREVVRWFRGDIGALRETNPECYRSDMQFLGEFMRRNVDPGVWVAGCNRNYDRARQSHGKPVVVVTDVRYPNELDWIKNRGGVLVWVDRDSAGKLNDHPSESYYEYLRQSADYHIENNGTIEDLRAAAVRFGNGQPAAETNETPLSGVCGSGE